MVICAYVSVPFIGDMVALAVTESVTSHHRTSDLSPYSTDCVTLCGCQHSSSSTKCDTAHHCDSNTYCNSNYRCVSVTSCDSHSVVCDIAAGGLPVFRYKLPCDSGSLLSCACSSDTGMSASSCDITEGALRETPKRTNEEASTIFASDIGNCGSVFRNNLTKGTVCQTEAADITSEVRTHKRSESFVCATKEEAFYLQDVSHDEVEHNIKFISRLEHEEEEEEEPKYYYHDTNDCKSASSMSNLSKWAGMLTLRRLRHKRRKHGNVSAASSTSKLNAVSSRATSTSALDMLSVRTPASSNFLSSANSINTPISQFSNHSHNRIQCSSNNPQNLSSSSSSSWAVRGSLNATLKRIKRRHSRRVCEAGVRRSKSVSDVKSFGVLPRAVFGRIQTNKVSSSEY